MIRKTLVKSSKSKDGIFLRYTPPKTNMEPNNGGWEDDFPLKERVIFRFHVSSEFCGAICQCMPMQFFEGIRLQNIKKMCCGVFSFMKCLINTQKEEIPTADAF